MGKVSAGQKRLQSGNSAYRHVARKPLSVNL